MSLAVFPAWVDPASVSAAPTAESRPGHLKVWLIGWDGMAPWIVEPMIAAGKLPHLKGLMVSGSVGELESLAPAQSPSLWTTVVTGKKRAQHGVIGFWKTDPETGVESLYSVSDRRAAPLWRIAHDAGLESAVIGWWATWPAEAIRGVVVSDRFALSRFDVHPKAENSAVPREGLISPPGMEPELADCLRRPLQITLEELGRFASGPLEVTESLELHDRLAELRMVFARDETHWCMARRLVERDSPNFLALHVQGTDIVNHYFLKYRYPERWPLDAPEGIVPEELERYRHTIEAYYAWQDRRLGELLRLADRQTVVFVLSDHGFRVGSRRRVPSVSGVHGGADAPPGLLVVSGPGIRSGQRLRGAHILDVAPTVLALWHLPVARDQPGRALVEAMVRAPAMRYVASYGDGFPPQPRLPELAVDKRIIQSLKSLGYLNE